MKRVVGVLLVAVSLSSPGFARANNSVTVNFSTSVRVGSTTLSQGSCKVTWKDSGVGVEVTFVQGQAVVTVPAKLVQAQNHWTPLENEGFEIDTQQRDDGTVLQEIRLKHLNLLFGP